MPRERCVDAGRPAGATAHKTQVQPQMLSLVWKKSKVVGFGHVATMRKKKYKPPPAFGVRTSSGKATLRRYVYFPLPRGDLLSLSWSVAAPADAPTHRHRLPSVALETRAGENGKWMNSGLLVSDVFEKWPTSIKKTTTVFPKPAKAVFQSRHNHEQCVDPTLLFLGFPAWHARRTPQ